MEVGLGPLSRAWSAGGRCGGVKKKLPVATGGKMGENGDPIWGKMGKNMDRIFPHFFPIFPGKPPPVAPVAPPADQARLPPGGPKLALYTTVTGSK